MMGEQLLNMWNMWAFITKSVITTSLAAAATHLVSVPVIGGGVNTRALVAS